MGNKYLYSKIMSSKEDIVQLLLTEEELASLKKLGLELKITKDNYVTVNKAQFMEKIAA